MFTNSTIYCCSLCRRATSAELPSPQRSVAPQLRCTSPVSPLTLAAWPPMRRPTWTLLRQHLQTNANGSFMYESTNYVEQKISIQLCSGSFVTTYGIIYIRRYIDDTYALLKSKLFLATSHQRRHAYNWNTYDKKDTD